jgi:hypothetical protein
MRMGAEQLRNLDTEHDFVTKLERLFPSASRAQTSLV